MSVKSGVLDASSDDIYQAEPELWDLEAVAGLDTTASGFELAADLPAVLAELPWLPPRALSTEIEPRAQYAGRSQLFQALIARQATGALRQVDLDRAEKWLTAVNRLCEYVAKQTELSERILYDGQVPVMEDFYWFLEQSGPGGCQGRMVLPTGCGKTVLFVEFAKAMGLRTLVVVPTKDLVEQTAARFEQFDPNHELTVGKVYQEEKRNDCQVTITTYDSLVIQSHRPEAESHIKPTEYDLVILDEAHHALGESVQATLPLYDQAIVVGMTATDEYSSSRKLESVLPALVHRMSIQEAEALGMVAPYANIVIKTNTDLSGVKINQLQTYDAKQLEAAINIDPRNQIVAEFYTQFLEGQKMIVYCGGVKHAQALADLLVTYGVRAEAIFGEQPTDQRREILENLAKPISEGGLEVVCNDRLLAEGFDETSISVVWNLVPTTSMVREPQRSGRVLRLDPRNPHKVALVISTIDANYQLAPVIFADEALAGAARMGVDSLADLDLLDGSEINGAQIVTDPAVVESVARQLAVEREQRIRTFAAAPLGWRTSGQVATIYGLTKVETSEGLKALSSDNDGQAGRFMPIEAGLGLFRRPRQYYSEAVIQQFVEERGLPFTNGQVPGGWANSLKLKEMFGPLSVEGAIKHLARGLEGTALADHTAVFGHEEASEEY
ncbi:DEAD/DEAH box helicase, partial [Candidatus Microgenomates bacterium]|nr:DEAD/DEAH box helicase [Candidatus Microgenomates bacterium]